MVPGMTCWVYSTMTTASAPGGSTPPVGMLTAAPGPTVTAGSLSITGPIGTAPVTWR